MIVLNKKPLWDDLSSGMEAEDQIGREVFLLSLSVTGK
jgi:hypothetical protein